jgi:hypothetical protein
MTKELEVRAMFRAGSDEALERLRVLLPEADIRTDGREVRVTAFYDDSQHGPGVLPEGAEVARRQVVECGGIAGLGPALESSVEVRDI